MDGLTQESFLADLQNKQAEEIYSKYISSGDTWYFSEYIKSDNPSEQYKDLKKLISKKLRFNFHNIAIVGSAKLGFSIVSDKDFKKFDSSSDIDIALVDRKRFYFYWNEYLELYKNCSYIHNYKFVVSAIFKRSITFEGFQYRNKYFGEWVKNINSMNKDIQLRFKIKHKIHYKLYESWRAVEFYYFHYINKLKKGLGGSINGI